MRRPFLIPHMRRLWRGPHTLQLGTDPSVATVLELDNPATARVLDLLDGTRSEQAVIATAAAYQVEAREVEALLAVLAGGGLLVPGKALLPVGLTDAQRDRMAREAGALALAALRPEPQPAMPRRVPPPLLRPEPPAAVLRPEPPAAVLRPEPPAAVLRPEPLPAAPRPEPLPAVLRPEPLPAAGRSGGRSAPGWGGTDGSAQTRGRRAMPDLGEPAPPGGRKLPALPADPAPTSFSPASLSPADPTTADPTTADPTTADLSRADPSPASPTADDPTRADPSPASPTADSPTADDPTRVDPSPASPTADDPSPAYLSRVDPSPTGLAPAGPAPAPTAPAQAAYQDLASTQTAHPAPAPTQTAHPAPTPTSATQTAHPASAPTAPTQTAYPASAPPAPTQTAHTTPEPIAPSQTAHPASRPGAAAATAAPRAVSLALAPDPATPAEMLRRRAAARVLVAGHAWLGALVATTLGAAGIGRLDPALDGWTRVDDAMVGGLLPADAHRSRAAAAADAVRRVAPEAVLTPLREGTATFVVRVGLRPGTALATRGVRQRGAPRLDVYLRDGVVVVGPLVLPDASPCGRCLDLHRRDRDDAWPAILAQLATGRDTVEACTVTTALAGAAYAAEEVLRHTDGRPVRTLGATVEISGPGVARRRSWPTHPLCDCSRRRRSSRSCRQSDRSGNNGS